MDEKTGLALDLADIEWEELTIEEILSLAEGVEVLGVPHEVFYLLPSHIFDLVKLLPFPVKLSLAYVRRGVEEGVLEVDKRGTVKAVRSPRFIRVSLSDVEKALEVVPKCFRRIFLGKKEFYQVKTEDPETFGKKVLFHYLRPAFGVVEKSLSEDWNYLFVGDGSCLAYLFDFLSGGRLKERTTIVDIDEDVVRAYREIGFRAYTGDLRFMKDFVLPFPYHFIYTYHIEFYQTDAVLDFVRANLLPYGVWLSYITPAESEREWVFSLMRFIEESGFVITDFIGKFFRAVKVPDPERRLLWRRG